MLLLRKESFFRFNRMMLVAIMMLSLVLPLCNLHCLSMGVNPVNQHLQGVIEIGMPYAEVISEKGGMAHEGMNINWWSVVSYLYIIGLVITVLWKLLQILLLYRQIHRGVLWTEKQGDVTIYCHANDIAPFSWFNTIVISEDDFNNNATEILRHEMGHIQSRHSLDILLVNVVESLQWCNPLAWILAGSLRDVHEYEADDAVLRSGVNAYQYQSLLIKKAVGSSSYAFANSFNHSLLKKRITMMLQKKSNPWMRGKALYILPVAVIALSAFATPELNQQVESVMNKVTENRGKVTKLSEIPQALAAESEVLPEELSEENVEIAEIPDMMASDTVAQTISEPKLVSVKVVAEPQKRTIAEYRDNVKDDFNMPEPLILVDGKEGTGDVLTKLTTDQCDAVNVFRPEPAMKIWGDKGKNGVIEVRTKKTTADDAYETADKMPEYPGGNAELMNYLTSNVRYPKEAFDFGATGRVVVGLVIDKDGSVSEVKVESCSTRVPAPKEGNLDENTLAFQRKTARQAFKEEAMRVVNAMPKWTPGMKDGKKVRVRYHLPITFNLE